MSTTVELEIVDDLAKIRLVPSTDRRPPVLDHAVLDRFESVSDSIEAESGTLSAVRIESASPRFFCTGADISVLQELSRATIEAWIAHGHRAFDRIEHLSVPTIADVRGFAMGGGLELALACDLVYASHDAVFGQTEVRLGFVTGFGGGRRLATRTGLAKAKELSFTARHFSADEALSYGVVDYVGQPHEVDERIDALVGDLREGERAAIAAQKRIIDGSWLGDEAMNLTLERNESTPLVEHPGTKERVAAFLRQRAAKKEQRNE